MHKIALFLLKNCKNHTPLSPAAGDFASKPQASGGWWSLRALPPNSRTPSPSLRNPGYATEVLEDVRGLDFEVLVLEGQVLCI